MSVFTDKSINNKQFVRDSESVKLPQMKRRANSPTHKRRVNVYRGIFGMDDITYQLASCWNIQFW